MTANPAGPFLAVTNQGERHSPAHDPESLNHYRHMTAYHFARRYAEGSRVLDYGCGTGYGINFLYRRAPLESFLAVDPSPEAIAYCRRSYPDVADCFLLTGLQDPVPSQDFDLIVLFQVIEHVPDAHETLRNLRSALRSGGRLLITTPNVQRTGGDPLHPDNPFHLREYTQTELRRVCRQHFGEVIEMGVHASLRAGGRGLGWERIRALRAGRKAIRLMRPPIYVAPPSLADYSVRRHGIHEALDLLYECRNP